MSLQDNALPLFGVQGGISDWYMGWRCGLILGNRSDKRVQAVKQGYDAALIFLRGGLNILVQHQAYSLGRKGDYN